MKSHETINCQATSTLNGGKTDFPPVHLYLNFPGPELQHTKGGLRNAPIFQVMYRHAPVPL